MFQVRLPCCLGLKSRQSFSINVNKTRKHFARNTHLCARMFPQCFPVSHSGNIASSVSFLFSRCQLCLRYTAGNFNENSSMRALAKILRERANEHSSNFCEQFEQRSNFASTFKSDGTIRYPCIGLFRCPPCNHIPSNTTSTSWFINILSTAISCSLI